MLCPRGQTLISQPSDCPSAGLVGLDGVPGDTVLVPGLRCPAGLGGEVQLGTGGAEQKAAPCQRLGGCIVPFLLQDRLSAGTAGLLNTVRASVPLRDGCAHRKEVEIPSAAQCIHARGLSCGGACEREGEGSGQARPDAGPRDVPSRARLGVRGSRQRVHAAEGLSF